MGPTTIACPHCASVLQLPPDWQGPVVACGSCGGMVPTGGASTAMPPLPPLPGQAVEERSVIRRSGLVRDLYAWYGRDALLLGVVAWALLILVLYVPLAFLAGVMTAGPLILSVLGLATGIRGIVACRDRSTTGLVCAWSGLILSLPALLLSATLLVLFLISVFRSAE